jgi:MarR family transcriptional regulator for hemolysin
MATVEAPPTSDLCFLLTQGSHALTARLTSALGELGITPRDYCVLRNADAGEYTQRELADLACLDKTTMVVTLDHLEAAGLAERRPSRTDRRARIVGVTDAGRARVDEARVVYDRLVEDTLSVVPPHERRALMEGLRRLVTGPLATPAHTKNAGRRPAQRTA